MKYTRNEAGRMHIEFQDADCERGTLIELAYGRLRILGSSDVNGELEIDRGIAGALARVLAHYAETGKLPDRDIDPDVIPF